jgi:anti-anti-sigma regulatory factor
MSLRSTDSTIRITVEKAAKQTALRLEGRVAGVNVGAFQQAWQLLAPSLESRKLLIDLRGVTHMDANGREILAEIHAQTGAEILTSTLMTQYFADEARSHRPRHKGEEI